MNKKIKLICFIIGFAFVGVTLMVMLSAYFESTVTGEWGGMYMDVDAEHKVLYATWSGDPGMLASYDISDPHNIRLLNSTMVGLVNPWHVIVNKEEVYVGTTRGISIYDVSDPSRISYVKTINSSLYMTCPYLKDDYLYALNNNNHALMIYDVSDPVEWRLMSNTSVGCMTHLTVDDNDYVYLREMNGSVDDGLRIFDVSDKTHPVFVQDLLANESNKMSYNHWQSVWFDNVTNQSVLSCIDFRESSIVSYKVDYSDGYHLVFLNTSWDAGSHGTIPYWNYVNTMQIRWVGRNIICGYGCVVSLNDSASAGITILDMTNPGRPVFMSHESDDALLRYPHDIKIVDYMNGLRVAFIIEYGYGVRSLSAWDVTDPYMIKGALSHVDG